MPQAQWINWLQNLIQIPSTFEKEHQILAYLERILDSLGCTYERVPFIEEILREHPDSQLPISQVKGRYNLALKVLGCAGGRSLVLSSHLDIVPPGDSSQWTFPPFSGHIAENKIYGRGAMDDKAGVTIALAVLENLLNRAEPLAGDVIFHFVLEDEVTGNGTLLCLNAGYKGDAAMIIDGTRLDKAIRQHAGQLAFSVRVEGKPASVVVSHMGINAAEVLMDILLELRTRMFSLNSTRADPWMQFPRPYQISIQRLSSSSEVLTLPTSAEASCYMTFPPPHSLAQMRDLINTIVDDTAATYQTNAEVIWDGVFVAPVETNSSELEQVLQVSVEKVGLPPVAVGPSTGTSDLRHFAMAGIPCLLYGPGRGYNPHRFDEHYFLEDIAVMVQLYMNLVEQWCV